MLVLTRLPFLELLNITSPLSPFLMNQSCCTEMKMGAYSILVKLSIWESLPVYRLLPSGYFNPTSSHSLPWIPEWNVYLTVPYSRLAWVYNLYPLTVPSRFHKRSLPPSPWPTGRDMCLAATHSRRLSLILGRRDTNTLTHRPPNALNLLKRGCFDFYW